jgi:hypothetical protein
MIVIQGPNPSAVSDALAAVVAAKHNALSLANPQAAVDEAVMAFYQAVTDAITFLSGLPTSTSVVSTVNSAANATDPNAAVIAQLQQDNAALQAQVAAGEKAVAAFEAIIHPADASPASSEPATIQPTTPSA